MWWDQGGQGWSVGLGGGVASGAGLTEMEGLVQGQPVCVARRSSGRKGLGHGVGTRGVSREKGGSRGLPCS